MKPGEQRMRLERTALRIAKRKAARGYKPAHVRKRQIAAAAFAAGYQRGGVDALKRLQQRLQRNVAASRPSLVDRVRDRIPRAA
jgi:hypothetical protein